MVQQKLRGRTLHPMDSAGVSYNMRRIHLEGARIQVHPEGEPGKGYDLVAPLDASGHISVEGWRSQRALCFVHRLEGGEIVERGLLTHRGGGHGGGTWMIDYDPRKVGEEESGFHFEAHVYKPGEYVSIGGPDGYLYPYRVTTVLPR